MNTATQNEISSGNVARNERGFRAVVGLGMASAVVAGAASSPVAIFAMSAIGFYLAMTAITGSDPVYLGLNALSKAFATEQRSLAAS